MSTTYNLITEEIYFEGGFFTVFGIESVGDYTLRINNITTNKILICELVEKCNRLRLSQIHFKEICEDFVVKNY